MNAKEDKISIAGRKAIDAMVAAIEGMTPVESLAVVQLASASVMQRLLQQAFDKEEGKT